MSYTFELEWTNPSSPKVEQILHGLGRTGRLVCSEALDTRSPWPEGFVRVHLDGVSTRGVGVTRTGQGVEICLRACASEPDCRLALDLVGRFAEASGARVLAEYASDPVTFSELLEHHDAEWIDQQVRSGPRSLAAIVEMQGSTLTVPGPVRGWHIDPASLRELRGAGPPEEFHLRVLADIRRVQYLDLGDAFEATLMRATGEGTVVIFGPGLRYLLPRADRVVLTDESDRPPRLMSWDAFLRHVDFEPVDAGSVFVEPVDEERWRLLVSEAEPLSGG